MTVGEKIQYYRKQQGLSQEELGQKLLVSRQTVSLWEMNKTLPTVDNLILLKEIFGISVDSLLTEDAEASTPKAIPRERYRFSLSDGDVKEAFGAPVSMRKKKFFSFLMWTAVLVAFFLLTDGSIGAWFVFGIFFTGLISHFKVFAVLRKLCQTAAEENNGKTYLYEVFDQSLTVSVFREDRCIKKMVLDFEQFERVFRLAHVCVLQSRSELFIVPNSILCEHSFFTTFQPMGEEKRNLKPPRDKWSILSIVLFVASIGSILFAISLVGLVTSFNLNFTGNMWIFYLFIPIPVASVLYGFFLKKKGYPYLKNIVVGVIITGLLCIYGSFSFLFPDMSLDGEDPMTTVEQSVETDMIL